MANNDNIMQKIVIKPAVFCNCDDVQLIWKTSVNDNLNEPIKGCLGFMIERQKSDSTGNWGSTEILPNRVGFKDGTDPGDDMTKPSNIWPFQTYTWTDHGASNGDTLRYRITALALPQGGTPGDSVLEPIADSGWTDAIPVSPDCDQGISAFFNRGFVMSQFVARILKENNWQATDIKSHIQDIQEPLRRFISGELRKALLALLNEVNEHYNLSLYAALFELDDKELMDQICLMKGRANIVLSNGADKKGDENKTARDALNASQVNVKDRMLGYKGLGHNKFAVIYDMVKQKPVKVWTGSTNWTSTGLCTQVNNGILVQDEAVAGFYYNQWNLLANAGNDFPLELVDSNSRSPQISNNINVWFTRVRNASKDNTTPGPDLQTLIDLVKSARQAVFYIMFMPGEEPLATLLNLPGTVFVKGVVSSVPSPTEEKFKIDGIDINSAKISEELVQPQGIDKAFSIWSEEISRGSFLANIGFAITHSKVIVIDPVSDNCKVITGSHNYSKSSSEENDENFVIIEGNKKLAEAYAVACLGTYSHYKWRAYVDSKLKAGQKVWSHLTPYDSWQSHYLNSEDLRKMYDVLGC